MALEKRNEPQSIFHPSLAKQWKKVLLGFAKIYVLYGIMVLAILSIFWGSFYGKDTRRTNLPVWVIDLDSDSSEYMKDNDINPVVGKVLTDSITDVSNVLGWKIRGGFNASDIDYIYHSIHQQKAWAAVIVYSNATENVHRALSGSSNSQPPFIEVVYEEAREPAVTTNYLIPGFYELQNSFLRKADDGIYKPLANTLQDGDQSAARGSPILFHFNNRLPLKTTELMAPLSTGLIFFFILSFFQVGLSLVVHTHFTGKVLHHHYIIYRWISAHVAYFVISLFYCLVSLAFQIDTSVTFGKSGFLVFWMINFLGMSAVGGASENVALILLKYFPAGQGFWLLFWVISNVAPMLGPIPLAPPVYHYGYGFPIYNILEATRIVLCDTTKKDMGRYVGVIIAWIAVNSALLPLTVTINTRKRK